MPCITRDIRESYRWNVVITPVFDCKEDIRLVILVYHISDLGCVRLCRLLCNDCIISRPDSFFHLEYREYLDGCRVVCEPASLILQIVISEIHPYRIFCPFRYRWGLEIDCVCEFILAHLLIHNHISIPFKPVLSFVATYIYRKFCGSIGHGIIFAAIRPHHLAIRRIYVIDRPYRLHREPCIHAICAHLIILQFDLCLKDRVRSEF